MQLKIHMIELLVQSPQHGGLCCDTACMIALHSVFTVMHCVVWFFLSWEKTAQHGKLLGLLVDSQLRQLVVPADTVTYIKEPIQQALDKKEKKDRKITPLGVITGASRPRGSPKPLS